MDLKGRTAIITGASRGIGRATAIAIARAGADVVINYSSSEAQAASVKEQIEEFGGSAVIFKADVTDYRQCEAMVKYAIDHFNKIDILINNAGITRDNLLARMKAEEWREVIDTNLTGIYNCCRAILRPLLKQKNGGRIVNIASVAGIYGNSGQTNYAAAKGGVIAFTKSLAKELGSRNITVNAVAPGFIETEMTDTLSGKVKEEVLSRIALGRFGKPEDIADTVLFLASSASAYITGQIIVVDGSLSM
ncbi:MAG: 3-oxoacyl-[acyl-carrier-protein] reductase [Firmicutes bacterium]|nr:3-oxoacyl-[acyl-carrier-protein] reductase [Bacillota bacterium]